MTPEEEMVRAGHAREVFESAMFKEAQSHVLDGITYQMAKCPVHDQTMHTRLIMMLQLWKALESYLQNVVETGKMAEFQVAAEEKKRGFFTR